MAKKIWVIEERIRKDGKWSEWTPQFLCDSLEEARMCVSSSSTRQFRVQAYVRARATK